MFCQDEALAQRGGNLCITDYDLMYQCFKRVRNMAQIQKMRVYIPRNIGCGIAGGNWDTVKQIMEDVFGRGPVDAFIVGREVGNG